MNEVILMTDPKRVEAFFDAIDESCLAFYEEMGTPYLDGIAETVNNLMAGTVGQPGLKPATRTRLAATLNVLRETEFQKEEIRKALQLAILRGFKHVRRPNGDITPDTIGLLCVFLLEKLYAGAKKLILLDPLAGTGNLLLTIANNLSIETVPAGVENDIVSYRLAEAMFDAMQYPDDGLYFQDTFTFRHFQADAVVTDFPFGNPQGGKYLPFETIRFHHENLVPGGYYLAVIPDDFFEVEGSGDFRVLLKDLYQVIGLVKLPATMFKQMGKSILILQKRQEGMDPITKVLLAEIPSFQDPNAVNEALRRMTGWFSDNIKKKEDN